MTPIAPLLTGLKGEEHTIRVGTGTGSGSDTSPRVGVGAGTGAGTGRGSRSELTKRAYLEAELYTKPKESYTQALLDFFEQRLQELGELNDRQIMAMYCYNKSGVTGIEPEKLVLVLDKLLEIESSGGQDVSTHRALQVSLLLPSSLVVRNLPMPNAAKPCTYLFALPTL